MSRIQSVVFLKRDGWTKEKARAWFKNTKLRPIKPVDDHLIGELRYRLRDPKLFRHFITKIIGNGVHLVIGFK